MIKKNTFKSLPDLVPLLILVLLGELLSALEDVSPLGFAGNLARNAYYGEKFRQN